LFLGAPASSSTYAHTACAAHHYKLMAMLLYKDRPALQPCTMLASSIVHQHP